MKYTTELTTTARYHAEHIGVAASLTALVLKEWVQVGDVIELASAQGKNAFVVSSRRVVIASGDPKELVIRLDYPVRF